MLNELKININKENIEENCINLFEKYGNEIVLDHTLRVVKKTEKIAQMYKLPQGKLAVAVFLHDISVVVPRIEYSAICRNYHFNLLPIEIELPILMHQKVSQIIAEQVFEINDTEILSAIGCHTTLKANPSKIDMALFIADKLEWDQAGEPLYKKKVEKALGNSLLSACYTYITYIIDNNMIIKPHPDLLSAGVWLKKYLT